MSKLKIKHILSRKPKRKITMLTCYDYSFAKTLDQAGIDIILVGDSLANVVLGMNETRKVSIKEMLNHTQAVAKGVNRSLVVADMPYLSYQKDPGRCLYWANKFIAAGADAVKIEWFNKCPYVVKRLIKSKIPVMGHIGLTPQTVHLLGGYKVQGKNQESASKLIKQAKQLEDLGVFSLVLECIPLELSLKITKSLKVPTIGIGAGKYCDGQVLVLYDLLGLYPGKKLKFSRCYKDLNREVIRAILSFSKDVKKGRFPSLNESFTARQ